MSPVLAAVLGTAAVTVVVWVAIEWAAFKECGCDPTGEDWLEIDAPTLRRLIDAHTETWPEPDDAPLNLFEQAVIDAYEQEFNR